jgi:hypothetical protein
LPVLLFPFSVARNQQSQRISTIMPASHLRMKKEEEEEEEEEEELST